MTAPSRSPSQFWAWFSPHAQTLTWPPAPDFMEELGEQIHAVAPGLGFEFSCDDRIVMAISASGNPDLFELVAAMVAAAPTFHGLRVVAFRQRGPISTFALRQADGKELNVDDVWFRLSTSNDGINLALFVRDFPAERPGEKQEAVYLLLDNALGEFDVVTNIRTIDWHYLPKNPARAGLSPLVELPVKFDRAMKRR